MVVFPNIQQPVLCHQNQKFEMDFEYDSEDSLLYLNTLEGNNKIEITAKRINLDSLPLFKHKFTWTSDELR